MQPKYRLAGSQYVVLPLRRTPNRIIEISGGQGRNRRVSADIRWFDHVHGELSINGVVRQFYAVQDDQTIHLHMDGKVWQLEAVDAFSDAAGASGQAQSGQVKAPIPGVVLEITVREGDLVEEGQVLMLIESMKLQMEVKAGRAGIVQSLGVESAGASFDKGAVLASIQSAERQEPANREAVS
ncbi:acetyl-CoA carboxylase biotin carboxyl carrier protein subunit [Endozoicomonas sp.]|uniref:acetyl-CoA carboxylase biotin carboxyl carrier protein subunit n=1 Tax=Endozoicomonas sp. TaxID=1892382 RepID=UPI003AF95129